MRTAFVIAMIFSFCNCSIAQKKLSSNTNKISRIEFHVTYYVVNTEINVECDDYYTNFSPSRIDTFILTDKDSIDVFLKVVNKTIQKENKIEEYHSIDTRGIIYFYSNKSIVGKICLDNPIGLKMSTGLYNNIFYYLDGELSKYILSLKK